MQTLLFSLSTDQSLTPLWIVVVLLLILSTLLIYTCIKIHRYRHRLMDYEVELFLIRQRHEKERKEREELAKAAAATVEEAAEPEIEEQKIPTAITTGEIYEEYVDGSMTHSDMLFMQRLTIYIEQHLDSSELVVNSLCDFMGVTPLVLNKKLKTLVSMTANVYIRTIRLRRAAQLLRTARYTVADVTYDVGFSDLRYFRECFKREFGVLPQEYKDQNTNIIEHTKQPEE